MSSKREHQLEFCKKCTNRKLHRNHGIICALTDKKADFEDICSSFNIDSNRIDELNSRNTSSKSRSKIAFGFSPKRVETINVSDLTKQQAYVIAHKAIEQLGWQTSLISENGLIAYTKFSIRSWSEEIKIKIELGSLSIKSECTGNQLIDWGKNSRNINKFLSTFNTIKEEVSATDVLPAYEKISENFVSQEADIIGSPLSEKEKVSGLISLLIPSDGYYVTPIIVLLNTLLFSIMVISGINLFLPSNESLLLWGANFRPTTIEGEWWRLFTSTFLHIGVIHLFMNMYALMYIGLLLEPYLGRTRFLAAYILTGLAGSVTSIYWNEITISAGASGAIFGMYGIFLALLTTKYIEKSARKPLLISIFFFVGYNLANGLKGGIDNAAHIGGLISGILIGYIYYPSLLKPTLKQITIGITTVLFVACFFGLSSNIKSDIGDYNRDMDVFVQLEESALNVFRLPSTATDEQILNEITTIGLPNWEQALTLFEKVKKYDLPEVLVQKNQKLEKYCRLRIESYSLIKKSILEKTSRYDDEIYSHNKQIQSIIKELIEKQ